MSSKTPTPRLERATLPPPQQRPGNIITQDVKQNIKDCTVEGTVVHLGTKNISDNTTRQTAYKNNQGVQFIWGLCAASSSSVAEEYYKLQAELQEERDRNEFELQMQEQKFDQEMKLGIPQFTPFSHFADVKISSQVPAQQQQEMKQGRR